MHTSTDGRDESDVLTGLERERLSKKWLAKRVWTFVFLNVGAVIGFAWLHRFARPVRMTNNQDLQTYVCLLIVESLVLFSPSLIACLLMRWRLVRPMALIGVLLTLFSSAIYLVDLAIFLSIREHLLSDVFARLAQSVLPYLRSFVTIQHWLLFGAALFGWAVVQLGIWRLTRLICRREERQGDLSAFAMVLLFAVVMTPVVVVVYPSYRDWDNTIEAISKLTARHPATATGYFRANRAPLYKSYDFESLRGKVQMLDHAHLVDQQVDRYRRLTVRRRGDLNKNIGQRRKLPDVLVVISECLRPDAITAKTMPNVHRRAQQGIWLQQHYSSGNSSGYGFFGTMFGLDACLYEQAAKLPIGLFDGLKQVGYETGFFGRDDFEMFDMDTFCGPDRFDFSEYVERSASIRTDEIASQLAADFLDRKGKFVSDSGLPRLAFLYIYAPHDEWHGPQDDIHVIADSVDRIENRRHRNDKKFVQFLNSMHFLDRVISPLLKDDRVTFITGDHGQSFGEDGRTLHGTAMSTAQLRVGCVCFGPRIPSVRVAEPTFHLDLLPTIFDVLDLECTAPKVWTGVSLLDPIPADRIVSCRGLANHQYLFIEPNRRLDDPQLGYQGFLNWERLVLAPGATVDIDGESMDDEVTRSWQSAGLMRAWLRQQYGAEFADIPNDPILVLHRTISAERTTTRLRTIHLIGQLRDRRKEFLDDLEACLADPQEEVRQQAFKLIHSLSQE